MPKITTILCLPLFALLLVGCSKEPALQGLPIEVFDPELEYTGPLNTLGELSKGLVINTTALRAANNKLSTICVSAGRCKLTNGSAIQ